MIELSQTVVTEEQDLVIDEKTTLFPFALIVMGRKRTLYAIKKEERGRWVKELREVIGYSNIFNIFEIKVIAVGIST